MKFAHFDQVCATVTLCIESLSCSSVREATKPNMQNWLCYIHRDMNCNLLTKLLDKEANTFFISQNMLLVF